MLILRGLAASLYQVALFAALLLIPAGTWRWPRAIQFLGVFGLFLVLTTVLLALLAPESLEARLRPPVAGDQPLVDRWITPLLLVSICGWVAFIPLDVFRWHLLPQPPGWLEAVGAGGGCLGLLLMFLAVLQNAYAAPVVTAQAERHPRLIDTGLYGVLRHPLYLGLLLMLAGMALWLESAASLITLVGVGGLLVARLWVEEQNLRRTLPGYVEYMKRVRYRLVPGVW